MRSSNPKDANDFNCVIGSSLPREARRFPKNLAYIGYGEECARGAFSMFGISDLNVERVRGGSWPLKPPKPNRVAGAKGSSMFPVDCIAFDLPYALRYLALDVPSGVRRACSQVYKCWKNAESAQVCPRSSPSFWHLAVFRISLWNNQVGSKDGVFGDQKALLGRSSQCPTIKSRCCSLNVLRDFVTLASGEAGLPQPGPLTAQTLIGLLEFFPEPRRDDKRWR
jgi:hypothetical protein